MRAGTRFLRACRAAGLLALAAVLPAAAAETAWRPAPIFGADVRSLAVHPHDPDRLWAGTSAGHLYRSTDGGESWSEPAAIPPFRAWVVGTLRFDPNPPAAAGGEPRLWAGLWGVWGGGMVAYSDDLGESWVYRRDGLPGDQIYSLTPVAGRPGRLYAGTRTGVYRSDDAGESWRRLTAALPEVEKVTSLLVDPERPETVYAGTWRRAYRSDDGGLTWRGVFAGMALDSEVFSLEPVPGRSGEIWASTCGWVYRTLDRGGTWTRFTEGLAERRTPSFRALPDGRLAAGTVGGLFLSADGGRSWQRRTGRELSVQAIANHPARAQRLILGTEGSGVWLSTDGGGTFRPSSRGMTNLRVAALGAVGREILAAVNHAGPASGIYSSIDGGASFQHQLAGLPPVLELAVDGDRAYAATERGLFERAGMSWARLPELGEGRVEGVTAAEGRVVARTAGGLYEGRGGRFRQAAYHHGPPRSAAPAAGALWVTDPAGVYRLTPERNDTVPAPLPGGRLERLGEHLLLAGEGGAWLRPPAGDAWVEVASGPTRALATGDGRYPVLLVGEEGARLFDPAGREERPVELDLPAAEVTSALVHGGRLFLGTAGYGLRVAELGS